MSSARMKTIFGDCFTTLGELFASVFATASVARSSKTSAAVVFMFERQRFSGWGSRCGDPHRKWSSPRLGEYSYISRARSSIILSKD